MICWSHRTRSYLNLTPVVSHVTCSQPIFLLQSFLTQSTVLRGKLTAHYVSCLNYTAHFLPPGFSATVRPCEMLQTSPSDPTGVWKWEGVNTRKQPLANWGREAENKFSPCLSLREINLGYISHSSSRAPEGIKPWGPYWRPQSTLGLTFSPSHFHASQYKHPECKTLFWALISGRTQTNSCYQKGPYKADRRDGVLDLSLLWSEIRTTQLLVSEEVMTLACSSITSTDRSLWGTEGSSQRKRSIGVCTSSGSQHGAQDNYHDSEAVWFYLIDLETWTKENHRFGLAN